MSDSTGEPERLAEILREIIALSQTGRPGNPGTETTNGIETGSANESESRSHEPLEQESDPD